MKNSLRACTKNDLQYQIMRDFNLMTIVLQIQTKIASELKFADSKFASGVFHYFRGQILSPGPASLQSCTFLIPNLERAFPKNVWLPPN
jgi:hypothetical protein